MGSKIKIREKRFLAFLLAFVFVLVQIAPTEVKAKTYTLDDVTNFGTDTVQPGDTLVFNSNSSKVSGFSISYCDIDGSTLSAMSAEAASAEDKQASFTVESYSDVAYAGTKMPAEQFKEWKITSLYSVSGGYLQSITLTAVGYTKSNITYELDGGENAATNPTEYTYGALYREAISK
ncbi:MAG: hypothetical protein Q4D54_04335 [Eubacteriales bacterium]|nr:hypothetical protein [Eubacteriales bacterium]